MPQPIVIQFEGVSADFLAEAKKVQKEMDIVSAKLKEAGVSQAAYNKVVAAHTKEAQKGTISITDFRSAYQTAIDVVRVAGKVWDETGQKFVDNAVLVGNLARSLGTTTEEASRLKEVADDVGISTDSLKTSMKLALKDGFEPNIDGLARMSDEYMKLAPGTERMQYLMDRFGKSGEEMGKLLEKGGASIRSMSAAMDEGLIVTEEAYQQAREYQIAVDDLKDSWDALTYEAAPPLVKAMTNVINSTRDEMRARELATEQGKTWAFLTMQQIDALEQQAAAERESADAAILAKEAAEGASGAFETEEERLKRVSEEAKAAADAIKEMTKANQDELKTLENLTGIIDTYKDKQSDLSAKHDELLAKKRELVAQYGEESKQVQEVNRDLEENSRAQQENADAFQDATNRRILARAEEILSIDGLTNEEKNGLIERGLAMGVYTQEAAARMREEESAALSLASSLNGIPNVSRTVTITTQYITQYGTANISQEQASMRGRGRASGGPVMAGEPYIVGEKGPEVVVPSQNGTVIPNNQASQMFDFDYNRNARSIKKAFREALAETGFG